jgi:hypothetical protein
VNFSVSRRHGGTVDGKQFVNLGRQPVGTQPGLLHVLRQLNVVIDDSAGSPEQAFAMLAQTAWRRWSRSRARANIIARKYKGEIDMLPTPLITTPMYLSVNRVYQRHQAQVSRQTLPCASAQFLSLCRDSSTDGSLSIRKCPY